MKPIYEEDPLVFISYTQRNPRDIKWAKWLRKRLEWYLIPSSSRKSFPKSRFIRPVFRDRDELDSGILTEEVKSRLDKAKFLLLICSPDSTCSAWVGEEITYFLENPGHDKRQIIPFIIAGKPNTYTEEDVCKHKPEECFHEELRKINLKNPVLGIAVTDDGKTNRQKAFIRVVARVLGRKFPSLWKRHQRFVRHVLEVLSLMIITLLSLAYWFMLPVRLDLSILDETSTLPGMDNGVLTINGSEYSISHPDTVLHIDPLPGYNRLKSVKLHFRANRYYDTIEERIVVGAGFRQRYDLQLHRDNTFAVFAGYVFDGDANDYSEAPIEGAHVQVGSYDSSTDKDGHFQIILPLEEQEQYKTILITKEGYLTKTRKDETPYSKLIYLLHRH